MSEPIHKTREAWLLAAVGLMTPLFKSKGYDVKPVRVSPGWPSKGGRANKKRTLGEAWPAAASADKTPEIFLTPMDAPEDVAAPTGILATLVHEVGHTVVGNEHGHKKPFKDCATAVGLEGKMTQTHAGEALVAEMKTWAQVLGPYPHAALNPLLSGKKKQSTRMIKCECPECGYAVRTSQKWLDIGVPKCPIHGDLEVAS